MTTRRRISDIMLAALFCFALACRYSRGLADFYATDLYPAISAVLSFISSAVPFSLQEIMIVVTVIVMILIPVGAVRRKEGFWNTALKECRILLILYVWFYMAWGINYYRSSIYQRAGIAPARFDKEMFVEFLQDYSTDANQAYRENIRSGSKVPDRNSLEKSVKEFYSEVPEKFGLSRPKPYQHPKKMIFGSLQAKCGVSGYIGPAFDEIHVVPYTPDLQYPHTFAHEYSHLLGNSNEAEANYWGFKACQHSDDAAVRYSGYVSILSHVASNARRLLTQEEYSQWLSTLEQGMKEDHTMMAEHWDSLRSPALDKIQTTVYNAFLKGNRIANGTENYSEVVLILMTLDKKEKY